MFAHKTSITWLGALCTFAVVACGEDTPNLATPIDPDNNSLDCSIPEREIIPGGPRPDGIPALRNNPTLVGPDDPAVDYLLADDRVIGVELGGQVIAMPHNIGWLHEIVNIEVGGLPIAITHCPLTGSSLAFDRGAADGANFLVSGLLIRNNLIMFDDQRNGEPSLWPQLSRGARCGPRDGRALPMIAVIEMTWEGWRSLHPDTRVVAGTLGSAAYHDTGYPYGPGYREGNSAPLFSMTVDRRRPTKERVLGIPEGEGGIAFPFGALDALGPVAAVQTALPDGSASVVLWDRDRQSAMAYRPVVGVETLTLEAKDGVIVDVETGSTWQVDGRSRSGPLAGERLEPVAEAYMAFWFGWAAFQPQTQIWTEVAE